MKWSILYRGPLSSCNYGCTYCPFAKTRNTRAELQDDARKLARFVDWTGAQQANIGVLFTPWGEAMIRKHYQKAFVALSHMPQVRKVAVQTNLTFPTSWLSECDLKKVAFWTTFHPTQTSLASFVGRCEKLSTLGARYSVGIVGFHEALPLARHLRALLPDDVYFWVNAYKRQPDYYTDEDVKAWEEIDPLFRFNTRHYASLGRACQAGATAFTVDGDGDARRCHFIAERIGNIYAQNFSQNLRPTACTAASCGCHIGYAHMDALGLYETFGDGLLERAAPVDIWRDRGEALARAMHKWGAVAGHPPVAGKILHSP